MRMFKIGLILLLASFVSCAPMPAFAASPAMSVGVSGEVVMTIKRGDESAEYKFHNLVVNQGLDSLMGATISPNWNKFYSGVIVSSNNAVPNATDTGVTGGLGFKTFDGSESSTAISTVAPYQIQYEQKATFAVGAVVGNVCKIATMMGGGTASLSAPISTSALVRVGGVPACVSVLATDQLIVVYRYNFVVEADISGTSTVTVDGTPTSFAWSARPQNIRTVASTGSAGSARVEAFGLSAAGGDKASRFTAANSFCVVTVAVCPGTIAGYTGVPVCGPYINGTFSKSCKFSIPTGTAYASIGMWSMNSGPISWQFIYSAAPMAKGADQVFEQSITFSIAAIPDP